MTELGRIPKDDLDRLSEMGPVETAETLRQALRWAPAMCLACGARSKVAPRAGTSFAGTCGCGGEIELLDRS